MYEYKWGILPRFCCYNCLQREPINDGYAFCISHLAKLTFLQLNPLTRHPILAARCWFFMSSDCLAVLTPVLVGSPLAHSCRTQISVLGGHLNSLYMTGSVSHTVCLTRVTYYMAELMSHPMWLLRSPMELSRNQHWSRWHQNWRLNDSIMLDPVGLWPPTQPSREKWKRRRRV